MAGLASPWPSLQKRKSIDFASDLRRCLGCRLVENVQTFGPVPSDALNAPDKDEKVEPTAEELAVIDAERHVVLRGLVFCDRPGGVGKGLLLERLRYR